MARAPSVWYRFDDHFKGDIIHHSVLVPQDGDTLDTYYCCMQWNAGMEGGAYCGIQDHPRGKAFIYSVWDPKQSKLPIKAAYKGLWTETANFGGEGTGLRAMNFSVGWKPDQWYSLVSRAWDQNNHTYLGFWVHNETERQWSHIITMDYPVKDVAFSSNTSCFVEDWANTGAHKRTAHYRHGYKRKLGGSWFPFSTAHFSVVTEASTKIHGHNYDAGAKGDYFYLTSGDSTQPSLGIGTSHTFHSSVPTHPTEAPIDFNITSAKPNLVTWSVPISSTPQFKYTVSCDGHLEGSGTEAEVVSQVLHGRHVGQTVEVRLEDILGNITTKTATIKQ